jgi:hypothetical protein
VIWTRTNGPKGEEPSSAWTVDGAHPSQVGNDLIARLLAKLDITPIPDQLMFPGVGGTPGQRALE